MDTQAPGTAFHSRPRCAQTNSVMRPKRADPVTVDACKATRDSHTACVSSPTRRTRKGSTRPPQPCPHPIPGPWPPYRATFQRCPAWPDMPATAAPAAGLTVVAERSAEPATADAVAVAATVPTTARRPGSRRRRARRRPGPRADHPHAGRGAAGHRGTLAVVAGRELGRGRTGRGPPRAPGAPHHVRRRPHARGDCRRRLARHRPAGHPPPAAAQVRELRCRNGLQGRGRAPA